MNTKKYYYIQFLGNCTGKPDIRVNNSKGIM